MLVSNVDGQAAVEHIAQVVARLRGKFRAGQKFIVLVQQSNRLLAAVPNFPLIRFIAERLNGKRLNAGLLLLDRIGL